jgi:hypothetical protein
MPVRHFITRFFDFMAAALVVFVRHELSGLKWQWRNPDDARKPTSMLKN